MKKLLTICIPTRNRVNTLNKNIEYLNSIILKRNLSHLINILVSDNSSPENFKKINKPKLEHFKILHSKDNGHDLNILNLVNNADSKFIWLCQDHTKILEYSLLNICKILTNDSFDYLFLATKKNYQLDKLIKNDKKFISFRNIYLNTNLLKLDVFKKKYNEIIKQFNQSHLVFHFSIISLCFENLDFKFEIITEKCSEYKFFDINDEHNKMTWSKNLINYINILNFSSKFYNSFISKNVKYKSKLKIIFNTYNNSIPTFYRIIQLLQKNTELKTIKTDFLDHPTFNKYEKLILTMIFKYCFNISNFFPIKLILVDLYYLIFLPKKYCKRVLKKISNLFLTH